MYMKNLIKSNIHVKLAKKYNAIRYVDDLLMLNNTGFEKGIADIYPPELQLKNTYYNILLRYTYL